MVHALRSRRVVTPHGEIDATVVIEDGLIIGVHPASHLDSRISNLPTGLPIEDLGNLALLPGLVDVHTHINEPGRTEWEGFATATRAAAAGGFTTLVDMPLNCLPETIDERALALKREAAFGSALPNTQHPTTNNASPNQCLVDLAFWGGAVDGNQAEIEPLALAGVAGYKCFLIYPGCDGFTEIDRANLELAIPHIAKTGLPLLTHAELAPSIDRAVARLNASGADWHKYSTYLASRPDEAELDAIAMLLDLCRAHRFRLHIVHLSTAKALPMLQAARLEGLPVTVETCPHYLHCAAEDIPDGATLFKCAPPIRSAANRDQLWAALESGLIDMIATDHSPCPPHMKRLAPDDPQLRHSERSAQGAVEGPASLPSQPPPGLEYGRFDQAWGGIPSLSTALSVLWTDCVARGVPLAKLAHWTSAAPAQLAGLGAWVGSIEPGKHANLVAFDADATFRLTPDRLHYRHAISPYLGETLRGVVRSTWLRGQQVYENREHPAFPLAPGGREYTLDSLHTH
ncbi:allantoinase [Bryocella elongata]|uniref:allantoinase n=1 Tax=Bryocella elongata TaxID=863522 RepID=A0A1H5WHI4_9BACT|nr:allantoinase AllB [Bryocella elongata]SEF98932.1 allantoinase [Bryocella elongata]